MLTAFVLLLAIAQCFATSTIWLSAFGDDANSGTSSGDAVLSLTRAYALAKGSSNHITLASGVVELQSITLAYDLTIVGESGNPSLSKFVCRTPSSTISTNSNQITLTGLSVESCSYPLNIGYSSTSAKGKARVTNCVLSDNRSDFLYKDGHSVIYVADTVLSGGTSILSSSRYYKTSSAGVTATFVNVKFGGMPSDLFSFTGERALSVDLNVTQCTFSAPKQTLDMAWIAISGSSQSLRLDRVTFVGPVGTSKCGVSVSNSAKAYIVDSTFEDHSGAPALCVASQAKVNVAGSEFTGNEGNSTVNGAPIGAAISLSDATLAVGGSTFKSNAVFGQAGGAGIYCYNGALTVGQSTLTYNRGSEDAADACWGCKVVAFSNTENRNSAGANPHSCGLKN